MSEEPLAARPTTALWQPHVQPELLIGSICATVTATSVWAVSGSKAALVWVVVAQLIYGVRFWADRYSKFGTSGPANSETRFSEVPRGMQLGLALTGILWGSAAVGCLLTQGLNWLTGVVFATTLALAILVLGCYLGKRALVIPFIVASVGPIALATLSLLEKATIAVGVSSLLLMGVFAISARYIDRLVASFQATDSEREKYQNLAAVSEQEIQRLRVGVKADREKQAELEQELGEASSNLIISEGKADALADALERVSPYDTETGLLNAKKYGNVIEREWARMLRQELPITIVHMQIDNFEGYKDSYGKIAYESAIRRIADLTRRSGTRPGDVVARIDENKFVLLFPEADHKNGESLANILRQQIRRLNIPNMSSAMHSAVTASFGVATVIPNSDLTIDDFNRRADAAVYEAQFQGGDKVVRYRTMNNVKLERWDRDHEGDLTPDGLVRKLAVLGYESKPRTYRPGEYQADQRIQTDTIDAIVQGKLKVSLEGESRLLHPGDCLFIPKGLVTSVEVVGDKPVICLKGTRA